MSGGSVKDLVRLLSAALASPHPEYPLSDELITGIHAYVDRHHHIDENEAEHLHEELLKVFETKVLGNPEKFPVFLGCIRTLRPVIIGKDRLLKWWEVLVRPTFDSMGQGKAVIADARAIVLSVMAFDEEDDPTGEREAASNVFTDKLLDIYLDTTRATTMKGGGVNAEQAYRFVSQNVEAVLLAYGKRRPQAFLEKIDYYVTHKESRLQILGLLCSYVRLQGPHLYYILRTPLFDHLLQCLENDTSTTVISLALTILIMFMPHLCNSLGQYLPRLFVIYTRVLCWDKFGVVRLDVHSSMSNYSRAPSPLSTQDSEVGTHGGGWEKLDSSFETASSTTPDVSDYFSFLYGLYPINFLAFIREPYKFLDRSNYKDIDQLDIDEETIRARTEPYRQRHILHPNFLMLTAETELSDQSRWMKVEPADVTAQCIGLVVNNMPTNSVPRVRTRAVSSSLPANLIPDDEIPDESLLDSDVQSESEAGGQLNNIDDVINVSCRSTVNSGLNSRDPRSSDSPTIPPTLNSNEDRHLQDMLSLQEQLHASLHESIKPGTTPTLPPQTALHHHHGQPPTYTNSAATSPRLGPYAQTLAQDFTPRSPAIRPARTDTDGTIAYLQREVMLLKNDLNFERYLKQQHLSHIGHLQRKHIKDSTAEAETQNLINTNRTLKAKLEKAKDAYTTLRQEFTNSRTQAKKWEAELSAKIRTLRDEQRAWRADEQATKSGLEAARIEADNLRKLLAESEADGLRCRQKLKTLNSEMEEVNKLRTFVDHLSKKVTEYQTQAEEYQLKKTEAESAVGQSEELKLRLKARDVEVQDLRRAYEDKLREMESLMNSISKPLPTSPGPKFQGMIDDALSVTNSKLTTLKKAHSLLLRKYTDLEIKHMELQAQYEMAAGTGMARSGSYHQYSSDNEGVSLSSSRVLPRGRLAQYQQSEDGMSPVGSYADSISSYQYGPYSPDYVPGAEFPFPRSHFRRGMKAASSLREGISTGNSSLATSPVDTIHAPGSDTNTVAHSQSDEAQSVRTVTSTTSSERRRREKVKPQSEARVRGRGGTQNIGKKIKDKEGEETPPKQKKKSRFATGSGLAGIRSFV